MKSEAKKVSELQIFLMSLFFVGFFADTYLLTKDLDWAADIRLFLLTAFWLFIGKIFRLSSIATFKIALIFLIILSAFFTLASQHPSVERIASWVYVFLFVGVVQQLWESRNK